MGKEIENILCYGDNLNVLREHIADNSIDLIYLDPPFQSGRDYNLLFEERNGTKSRAQIKAFEDTWHWGEEAEKTYNAIIEGRDCPARLVELIVGFRKFLGSNDMMAYLVMMAIRLVELHRVLKDTGSIYLHCDPTASHYLKLILDVIWGIKHFQREIIWRIGWVSGYKTQAKNWIRNHDVILYYTKSNQFTFNKEYIPYPEDYVRRDGKKPEGEGFPIEDTWNCHSGDVLNSIMIMSFSKEKLGYDTQKPEALLERIINASSNEGDTVLDPFCGCGTTVAVAQRLKRKWIGIDITHLAINLIRYRLNTRFEGKSKYKIIGLPKDYSGAKELSKQDKYEFQWWALGLLDGALPAGEEKQKGADRGIDGYIYFYDDIRPDRQLRKIIIQVKGGHVTSSQIRDLKGVLDREKAQIGVFITLEKPTREMIKEAASTGFYTSLWQNKKYPKLQILTIEELLNGKKIDYPPLREDVTLKKAQKYTEIPKHTQQKLIED